MRRGSLQLSINAIVILVMAIAMLGVGLYFISDVLRGTLDESIGVSDTVLQNIIAELRISGSKLTITPLSSEGLVMGRNQNKVIYVGILNRADSPASFQVDVSTVGTDALNLDEPQYDNQASEELPVGEPKVYPIRFASEATAGTALYEVTITNAGDGSVYATQQFFVTVQ